MLNEKSISISQIVDARKDKIEEIKAWEMLSTASSITIAKGKKSMQFSPEPQHKEEIMKNALGRSGTLRAPSLKIGTTFTIGFNEDLYDNLDR